MVLVSHTREFIFLKTIKTAGTTVEMCLEPACTSRRGPVKEKTKSRISPAGIVGSRMSRQRHPKWLFKSYNRWRNHMPAPEVADALGREMFDGYTKITAVRDPFTRCVSLFHYRNPDVSRGGADFSAIRAAFRDYMLNSNWPSDVNITHVDGRFVIDRAVRFEHLAEDTRALAQELGVPLDEDALPHTKPNASARKGHQAAEYYDADTIAAVQSKMAWVFDNYGYPDTPQSDPARAAPMTRPARSDSPDMGETLP